MGRWPVGLLVRWGIVSPAKKTLLPRNKTFQSEELSIARSGSQCSAEGFNDGRSSHFDLLISLNDVA